MLGRVELLAAVMEVLDRTQTMEMLDQQPLFLMVVAVGAVVEALQQQT
jgi:hypothetical protein